MKMFTLVVIDSDYLELFVDDERSSDGFEGFPSLIFKRMVELTLLFAGGRGGGGSGGGKSISI